MLTDMVTEIKSDMELENARRKSLTCKYCNKVYSSNAGITKHVRHNCDDCKRANFKIIIDLDRFKSYIDLVINLWVRIQTISFTMERINWASTKPKLMLKYPQKNYTYQVYKNEARSSVLDILNRFFDLPMSLLMDDVSIEMINENKQLIGLVNDSISSDDTLFMNEFAEKLGLNESKSDSE
jgi:phage FluMu protein Com